MLSSEQWTKVANELPLLEEIKTYWMSRDEGNGLITNMNGETNLKRVTFNMKLTEENHINLRDLLLPKWQIDGELKDNMTEITFARNN